MFEHRACRGCKGGKACVEKLHNTTRGYLCVAYVGAPRPQAYDIGIDGTRHAPLLANRCGSWCDSWSVAFEFSFGCKIVMCDDEVAWPPKSDMETLKKKDGHDPKASLARTPAISPSPPCNTLCKTGPRRPAPLARLAPHSGPGVRHKSDVRMMCVCYLETIQVKTRTYMLACIYRWMCTYTHAYTHTVTCTTCTAHADVYPTHRPWHAHTCAYIYIYIYTHISVYIYVYIYI